MKNIRKGSTIPGVFQVFYSPFYIPLLSNYIQFGNLDKQFELMKKYGDPETKTLRVSVANRNIILFCDGELFKQILITKGNYFEKPSFVYNAFNIFGEHLLSTQNNTSWKKHHKVVVNAFNNLDFVAEAAVKSADLLFETKWLKSCEEKGEYILTSKAADMNDISLDVIGKTGFGIDFGIFTNNKDGIVLKNVLQRVLFLGYILRRFLGRTAVKMMEKLSGLDKDIKIANEILDEIIEKRKKELKEATMNNVDETSEIEMKKDILTLLVKANLNENEILTNEEVKGNVAVFVAAGSDTTAGVLDSIIYELSKYPHLQEKARKEALNLGRKPNINDFQSSSLNYIQAIIAEGLRLHPPAPMITRTNTTTLTIGKFTIPKGSQIGLNFKAAHRNEKYWENPEEFNPDRFVDPIAREKFQSVYHYLPFSGGNRKCIGYKFAQIELQMVLTRLLQEFEFTLDTNEPIVFSEAPVHKPKNLRVKVNKLQ